MCTAHSGSHLDFLIYQFGLPLLPGSFQKKKTKTQTVTFSIEFRKNQDIDWKKVAKKLTSKNIPNILSLKYFFYPDTFLKKIPFLTIFPGALTEAFQAAFIEIAFAGCISVLLAAGTIPVCNYYRYLLLSVLNVCM